MTKIYAHRGSRGTHPENTLASFKEALRVGADGIELDVHLSKDGQVLVIHDETIDRTTNGEGLVKDLTCDQLRTYSAGAWFHPAYQDEKIPLLKEVFHLLIDHNFKGDLNIELKTDQINYEGLVQKCLDLQSECYLPFSIIYSSFNPETLKEVKQLDAEQEVAFLFYGEYGFDVDFGQTRIEGWHPSFELLEESIEKNQAGRPLRFWTVNSLSDMDQCLTHSVDTLMTDYPQTAISLRKSQQLEE